MKMELAALFVTHNALSLETKEEAIKTQTLPSNEDQQFPLKTASHFPKRLPVFQVEALMIP